MGTRRRRDPIEDNLHGIHFQTVKSVGADHFSLDLSIVFIKERQKQVSRKRFLSLRRLSLDEAQGQVVYQYRKHSGETEYMDYLEFIARVTSHIPDKGQVMIRYYGIYANAHRGKKKKAGVDPSCPPIIENEASFIPSSGWADIIRKVYEIDPPICPKCGGQMRVIAFITNYSVMDRIITLLKLTCHAERPLPHPEFSSSNF